MNTYINNMKGRILFTTVIAMLITACQVQQKAVYPEKKYSISQVQKDYSVYRQILQDYHPGLYWYTSKDTMDHYFDLGYSRLKDNMTEEEFRTDLSFVTARINCGHTTVRPSKGAVKYADTAKLGKLFPLSVKAWEDAVVTTVNLDRKQNQVKRGTVITSINYHPVKEITDSLLYYISSDGDNRTHKFQALSNRGNFGALYSSVFGKADSYPVDYLDPSGEKRSVILKAYDAEADTMDRNYARSLYAYYHLSKKEKHQRAISTVRLLKIDSVNHTAMMDLSSFANGYKLNSFFRKSFRVIKRMQIGHLIIDVRNNGGGNVGKSTLLSRFLVKQQFKICDTLYAERKCRAYKKYINQHFWNNLFISILCHKRTDGKYHFAYFERHYFSPRKRDHYDGKIYLLTGGNSFSATVLFVNSLKNQDNVTIVGEETGGTAYGNSAWLIPDVTLPETGVRFRLPLFRLVASASIPKDGKGVVPDVESKPSVEAVKNGADFKLDVVMKLIKEDKAKNGN
jgi:C-terminal processing protease CtpA/Prc